MNRGVSAAGVATPPVKTRPTSGPYAVPLQVSIDRLKQAIKDQPEFITWLVTQVEALSFIFITFFQLVLSLFMWAFLKLFTRLEVHGAGNLSQVEEPLIIVSNHESHLDPILVGIAIAHRPSLFPIRYLAKNELFFYPVFNLLIFLLGAFRAHKKKGLEKSLLTPLRTLRSKGAVVIFPEGHIVPTRPKIGAGRRGAAVLSAMSGAMILPLALNTPANLTLGKMFFGQPRITITIGQPFFLNNPKHKDFSDDYMTVPTREIMRRITELYSKYKYF